MSRGLPPVLPTVRFVIASSKCKQSETGWREKKAITVRTCDMSCYFASGMFCSAQFQEDGKWYRAKVNGEDFV